MLLFSYVVSWACFKYNK